MADGLRERARAAGYELREGGPTELVVDAGPTPAAQRARRGAAGGAVRVRQPGRARRAGAVGFHLLPPLESRSWS